jgi:hypothetical protein
MAAAASLTVRYGVKACLIASPHITSKFLH